MAIVTAGVNQDMLKWARETAGLTLQTAAARLSRNITAGVISQWETGELTPTYPQLETLARKYKRPVAIFFFPEPPSWVKEEVQFRVMDYPDAEKLEPDSRFAIREAIAKQRNLYELLGEKNTALPDEIRNYALDEFPSIGLAAQKLRRFIGVEINTQLDWEDSNEALKEWRNAIEKTGISVFLRSFKQGNIDGFSVFDEEYPVIYINNTNTTENRQIFSMFHEIAHILIRENGISFRTDDYLDWLSGQDRRIEKLCHQFAAEVLVPTEQLTKDWAQPSDTEHEAKRLSGRYKVSREVIIRRASECGIISEEEARQWIAEYYRDMSRKARSKGPGGGNYYWNEFKYLGNNYINLVLDAYYSEKISSFKAADYLKINEKIFSRFVDEYVLRVGRV